CFGAAQQVSLNLAYLFSQGFGWKWSENLKPHEDARFALVYTLAIPFAALLAPVIVLPLLILMNDRHYLREYRNGVVGNVLVSAVVVIAFLIALVAIPLQVLGG